MTDEDRQYHDILLYVFAKMADHEPDQNFGMDITLFTAAGTFAGLLVSQRRWLLVFREAMFKVNDVGAEIAASLKVLDDAIAEEDADSPIHLIHLENAFQLRGQEWVRLDPMGLWRGKIAEVTAWSAGAPSGR